MTSSESNGSGAKEAVGGSQPSGSYSPGMLAQGRFLFVSGQGPLRDGKVTGGDVEEQTRVTLDNVAAVLADGGAQLSDVVRCGVFLQNISDFAAMDRVYREYFGAPMPARTTVGADLDGILVEIDCVAVLPSVPS
ncbi:RidA family protein [Microbacterium lushaniae]|nr:RidA family protein [Microbacterium lushaniae]KAA9155346.1 RidA family protein [Microbacterium lushaniae]